MADPLHLLFLSEAKIQLAEAQVLLQGMARGLGMARANDINGCYRLIHTISGMAGYLGLERIQVLAQGVERLLEELRFHRFCRGAARIDALIRAVQRTADLVDCLAGNLQPVADDHDIIGELCSWVEGSSVSDETRRPWQDHRSVARFVGYGNQIPTGPPRLMMALQVVRS